MKNRYYIFCIFLATKTRKAQQQQVKNSNEYSVSFSRNQHESTNDNIINNSRSTTTTAIVNLSSFFQLNLSGTLVTILYLFFDGSQREARARGRCTEQIFNIQLKESVCQGSNRKDKGDNSLFACPSGIEFYCYICRCARWGKNRGIVPLSALQE